MRRTKNYAPPMIISKSRVYSDTAILAGSIVDVAGEIKAVGQEVETHDLSDFNHKWE